MRSIFIFIAFLLLISSCNDRPKFELLDSSYTGISFNNEVLDQDTFNILHNEYMYNGGGVGIADLNNDHLPDIIFAGNKVLSRIYLNKGNLQFEDITFNFEGLTDGQWISGIAVTDINSDGWIDLYFTSTQSLDSANRKNQLWVNQGLRNGIPFFREMARNYGIDDSGHSMHAAFFDYDLDGDLDLYILNNIVSKAIPTNYRPKITDGSSINNDRFYKNVNGKFVDVTIEAGIVYEGYGLGLAIGDINKDSYPDIYVSNDYISNDLLYINTGNGSFKNLSEQYLSYHSRFSMGNDMADINNDGNMDIITMDMMPEEYFRKKQTINGNSYYVYVNNEKYNYEPQYVRNMVHMHNGFLENRMNPFSEIGQLMGVYQTEWSWSPLFADFDNDGDRDLLITNGFPRDLTDKDFTNYKAGMYGSLTSDEAMIKIIPIVKVSNYAFENLNGLQFSNKTSKWGMDRPSFSNGAAFSDLDLDGDLDYVVNNINDPAFVYKNNQNSKEKTASSYILLNLKGAGRNTLAIGAKVELWSRGKFQYTEKFLSRGYISSVDPIIHFGLGKTETVDSIIVIWPTAKSITKLVNIKANQLLEISEEDSQIIKEPRPLQKESMLPLFKKYKGVAYFHKQEDYVDFFHGQSILQHKLSQIGPCIATGDIDSDGLQDLLVGGNGVEPMLFFTRAGDSLVSKKIPGLTEARKCMTSDLVIMDVDGDHDNDVVALSGGYANENTKDYLHKIYFNEGASFTESNLDLPPFPASIVRSMDFDKDGDLDLFVGARVSKGKYPLADKSYLLVNEGGGKFQIRDYFSFDLGMVTDATWTDFDSDGWSDLIITREWQSIVILRNEQGNRMSFVKSESTDNKSGFWYSIKAGDLDSDGDEDLIVGNLGENHRFTVSEKTPMRLYSIDIDKNGTIDPIVSSYWKDEKGVLTEFPVNYLDELGGQSPFFKKMFTSYKAFSHAPIKTILNPDSIRKERIYSVNTTSSYVLWNEKGKFTWEPLPMAAQYSPIKKILIHDFNADGDPDLLLVGNDYSYDVSTGYYDSNKGLMMLGFGGRTFKVLSQSESGLIINGQVESLVYLEGESPILVAGVNRDSAQTFKSIKKK